MPVLCRSLQVGRSWFRFPVVSLEFFIDIILPVDSASNRNEYQEYFLGGEGGRCLGLTTLPPSCADCLEAWEPQPPGTLWACNRSVMELLYLFTVLCKFYYFLMDGKWGAGLRFYFLFSLSFAIIAFMHCALKWQSACPIKWRYALVPYIYFFLYLANIFQLKRILLSH
jgi:hypothetical protein